MQLGLHISTHIQESPQVMLPTPISADRSCWPSASPKPCERVERLKEALERRKLQGGARLRLLALVGSERAQGTEGSIEQRPEEDQCDETRACLDIALDPYQARMGPLPAWPTLSSPSLPGVFFAIRPLSPYSLVSLGCLGSPPFFLSLSVMLAFFVYSEVLFQGEKKE